MKRNVYKPKSKRWYEPGEGAWTSPLASRLKRVAEKRGLVLVRKDFLARGTWYVSTPTGETVKQVYTAGDLEKMQSEFRRATRGKKANRYYLCWDHGKDGNVSAKNHIAPIADIELGPDGRLYSYHMVSKGTQAVLNERGAWVSPQIRRGYKDGAGREYELLPTHIGIADRPVIGGQAEFVQLSQQDGYSATRGNAMDFEKLLKQVNQLLSAYGVSMPQATTEDNFSDMLDIVLQMLVSGGQLEAGEDESEDDSTDGEGAGQATDVPAPDPAATVQGSQRDKRTAVVINAALAPLVAQVKTLQQQVVQLSQASAGNRKATYLAAVTQLAAAGKIDAAQAKFYAAQAKKNDYDLSALPGMDSANVVNLSQLTAPAVNGKAPTTSAYSAKTQAEIEKLADSIGGTRKAKV